MDPPELDILRNEGDIQIRKFVEEVNCMTSFAIPKQDEEEPIVKLTFMQKVRSWTYFDLFFRFFSSFLLIFALTSFAVYLASLKFTLNPDAMATLIIGTSVGGAAALCAALPKWPRQQ